MADLRPVSEAGHKVIQQRVFGDRCGAASCQLSMDSFSVTVTVQARPVDLVAADASTGFRAPCWSIMR